MRKKLIVKYILMYLPFVLGIGLYSFKIYNIYSSLLFFLGGYVAIKNTFDYRLVKRNRDISKVDNNVKIDNENKYSNDNDMVFKRVKKHSRIRKRTKY